MGQKVHPLGFRLGITEGHSSRWFSKFTDYSRLLQDDYKIRQRFETLCRRVVPAHGRQGPGAKVVNLIDAAGITKVVIYRRTVDAGLWVYIHAAQPSRLEHDWELLEGKDWGKGQRMSFISALKYELGLLSGRFKVKEIVVRKVFTPGADSLLVARAIAERLEKRVMFRKVLYQCRRDLEGLRTVKGFKIQLSGRLGGAEIARTQWIHGGRMPLQTLRANISYTSYPANTRYGIIGIKVWIFKVTARSYRPVVNKIGYAHT